MTDIAALLREAAKHIRHGTFTAELVAEMDAAAAEVESAEPVAYRYEFVCPISGRRLWRPDAGPWNGQSPKSSEPLYRHPPSAVPEGLERAARHLENKAEAYDFEHGSTDPSTGSREYPGDGADYYNNLMELAEEIRMLTATGDSHHE